MTNSDTFDVPFAELDSPAFMEPFCCRSDAGCKEHFNFICPLDLARIYRRFPMRRIASNFGYKNDSKKCH